MAYSMFHFQVKDFEQLHEFQKYLERLRKQRDDEGVQEVDGLVDGKKGAKGIIVFSQDFSMVGQAAVVKLPQSFPWCNFGHRECRQ